ncbi:UNVERIFIED_CONTAM: hypothetical protein NCL1_40941 [Trichonephila clavipes]
MIESKHYVYRIVIQNNRVYRISVQLNALKREKKKSFKVLTQVAKNETNGSVSIMFDSSSFANPTRLAHANASRDVLPRGGTSQYHNLSNFLSSEKFLAWNE